MAVVSSLNPSHQSAIAGATVAALDDVGARPAEVSVERVAAIPRTALGKAPLITRAPALSPIGATTGR